ncbi:MAG: hypothetical protein ACPG4N_06910 [Gammaproteobacteria bacterium]
MKQTQNTDEQADMREEYDFANMKDGVQGKYADSLGETAVTVLLDSDVAKLFPSSQAVNEALRTMARVLREDRETQAR